MKENNLGMKENNLGWKLLTRVSNDIEAEMIKNILEMGNIPMIKKVPGVDNFVKILCGVPIGGVEIHVPVDKWEEANGLLEAQLVDDGDQQ